MTRNVSSTQAQAAVMAQVAARFDDVQASLRSTLTNLLREVESVRADWQGSGGDSFQQVTAAWGNDQRRLLTALAETATAVRTAGRVYTAADDSAAQRMSSSISLPL